MSPSQPEAGPPPAGSAIPPAARRNEVPPRCGTRLAFCFAIASSLAVGAGCIVAASTGVRAGVWMRNASAWVIGAVLAQLVARLPPTRLFRAVWLLAPMALLIGLLGPGQSGVHRWISLGPLNWNVAFLALPAATVAIAAAARGPSRAAWWAALVMELGLCLQPDASQATAFAAAIVVALLMERPLGRVRLAVGLFFVLATGIAWTRPDPLKPLPEVEGILELACAVSWPMAILCVASLAAVIASPLSALSKAFPDARSPAVALGVYFLACTLAPLFGAFPVPLIGIGMSPILGFWLGIGALMAACRSEPDRPSA